MEESCPNCKELYTIGVWKANQPLSAEQVAVINQLTGDNKSSYCTRCGEKIWVNIEDKVRGESKLLSDQIARSIDLVPVITLQMPHGWEYEVLGMVTGQSTTGTGVLAEFSSAITDLFGLQSGTYNKKLRAGEALCYTQIRSQTMLLGGNAVIGADINYAEVGGGKGMLMVCMTGTAIRLLNTEILGIERSKKIEDLIGLTRRLSALTRPVTQ